MTTEVQTAKMIYATPNVAHMLSGLMNKRAGEKRFSVEKIETGWRIVDANAVVATPITFTQKSNIVVPVSGEFLEFEFDFARQTGKWLYFKNAPIQWVFKGNLIGFDVIGETFGAKRVKIKVTSKVAKKLGLSA